MASQLRAWLDSTLSEARPGATLPLDAELASTFQVSVSTVRRVMREYASRGLVSRSPGRATRVPGAATRTMPKGFSPQSSPEAIADLLYRQISTGALKIGSPLPATKLLAQEWHIATATITTACRLLCDRRVLTRVGRSYVVCSPDRVLPESPHRQVVTFEPSGDMDMRHLYTDHPLALAYQAMEFELLRHRYHIDYRPMDDLYMLVRAWVDARQGPHALCVSYVSGRVTELKHHLRVLSRRLGRAAPRVLLCGKMVGTPPAGTVQFSHGHLNTELFRTLADHCARRRYGHLHVYAGPPAAPMSNGSLMKLFVECRHAVPTMSITYVNTQQSGEIRSSDDRLRAFLSHPAAHARAVLSKYEPTDPSAFAEAFVDHPTLDNALTQTAPGDAWVFRSQHAAVEACRFLEARNLRPAVTVVSLENRPEFFTTPMTVCVPDTYTIGYQMAHAIMGDFAVARSSRGYMRTPIVLLERSPAHTRQSAVP